MACMSRTDAPLQCRCCCCCCCYLLLLVHVSPVAKKPWSASHIWGTTTRQQLSNNNVAVAATEKYSMAWQQVALAATLKQTKTKAKQLQKKIQSARGCGGNNNPGIFPTAFLFPPLLLLLLSKRFLNAHYYRPQTANRLQLAAFVASALLLSFFVCLLPPLTLAPYQRVWHRAAKCHNNHSNNAALCIHIKPYFFLLFFKNFQNNITRHFWLLAGASCHSVRVRHGFAIYGLCVGVAYSLRDCALLHVAPYATLQQ